MTDLGAELGTFLPLPLAGLLFDLRGPPEIRVDSTIFSSPSSSSSSSRDLVSLVVVIVVVTTVPALPVLPDDDLTTFSSSATLSPSQRN